MKGKLKSLMGCETRPMSEEETKIMLVLIWTKEDDKLAEIDQQLREKKCFQYMVMVKRLECLKAISPNVEIGFGPKIFCSLISQTTGQVVMWSYTLNEMFLKYGHKITMNDFVEEFPMGVPLDEEYKKVWELQKKNEEERGGEYNDNKIDDFSNWGIQ